MGTFAFEDPLLYLPRKKVQHFPKDRIVYDPQLPSDSLYVITMGRVKITTRADGGADTIGRIVTTDGLFGESILVGKTWAETATTLDSVLAMAWTRDEIEQQIEREPRLGIALSQQMVRHCIELQQRIESMALLRTPERMMLGLVQLANSLGTRMNDGSTRIEALTHLTLAEYVGTSREMVTLEMNRLRRLGMIRYSRKHIDIHIEPMMGVLDGKRSLSTG